MKTTKKELNSLVSILNSDRPKELKTAKENKKSTGKKKSLNFGIKAKKEVIKPINQRGKDNLNKFLSQHTRRLHVENRTRFYQLRISLKEKDFSRIITKEINPKIESCYLTVKNLYTELKQDLKDRYTNKESIYKKISLIRQNRSKIVQLTDRKNNLLFMYKFRYSIMKQLFTLLSVKTNAVKSEENPQDKTNETELSLSSEVLSLIDTYEDNLTSSLKLTNFVTSPANNEGREGGERINPVLNSSESLKSNTLNTVTSGEKKSGFGIDLIRNSIYSTLPLPFDMVQSYLKQFTALLNSKEIPPFKIIRKRDELKRFNIAKREYEILSKDENIEVIRLLDLFKLGIYRESKNNNHHLRQVSATNLLKFETYQNIEDILTTKEGKEYISTFERLFSELINIEDIQTEEKQNEMSIHTAIITMSKRYAMNFNNNEHLKDVIQDAYIHFTLEKPVFSLTAKEMDTKMSQYFQNRLSEFATNKSKFSGTESEDIEGNPILNIPFHLNTNTAYQIEQCIDFDFFIHWIESRKYIADRTKEVILYILENLTMNKKELRENLNISEGYLKNCIEKLTVYSKRYNDLSIYEFLMHKYYNKPFNLANLTLKSEDYKTPAILKGKAIKELKSREKIVIGRKFTAGRNKEIIKSFNYELSKSGKVGITYDIV